VTTAWRARGRAEGDHDSCGRRRLLAFSLPLGLVLALLGTSSTSSGHRAWRRRQAASSQRVDEEAEYESPLTGSWAHLQKKDGDVGSRMDG
jgi:hypothetical protein